MPLQIRRGTTTERTSITPLAGELIYDTTLGSVYIGNGATVGGVGVTGFTTEDAVDAVGAALVAGVHSGITFTYGVTQDNAGRIDATIGGGVVNLDIRGSVFSDDTSTILIDGVLAAINLDQTIKSNVVPALDVTYDLGTASHRFKDIYLSGSSIFLGNATITSTGSSVNLPSGSTVGGVPIGAGSGDGVVAGSNYTINIIGDDSTLIVNSSTKSITAAGGLFGNVTGSVIGNVTGDVTGNVTGVVIGTAGSSLIGNVTGYHTGDVKGSIFGDDSTKIVDAVENKVYADFFGNLTGNVTGSTVDATDIETDYLRSEIITIVPNAITGLGGINIVTFGDDTDDYDLFSILCFHDTSNSNSSRYIRARGNNLAPVTVQSGDIIHQLSFVAITGATTSVENVKLSAQVDAAGTVNATQAPGKFIISTQNASGSMTEGLTIDMNSVIGLNSNQSLVAGAGSGEVNLGGGVVTYVKIKVGTTVYAAPLYAINP